MTTLIRLMQLINEMQNNQYIITSTFLLNFMQIKNYLLIHFLERNESFRLKKATSNPVSIETKSSRYNKIYQTK